MCALITKLSFAKLQNPLQHCRRPFLVSFLFSSGGKVTGREKIDKIARLPSPRPNAPSNTQASSQERIADLFLFPDYPIPEPVALLPPPDILVAVSMAYMWSFELWFP